MACLLVDPFSILLSICLHGESSFSLPVKLFFRGSVAFSITKSGFSIWTWLSGCCDCCLGLWRGFMSFEEPVRLLGVKRALEMGLGLVALLQGDTELALLVTGSNILCLLWILLSLHCWFWLDIWLPNWLLPTWLAILFVFTLSYWLFSTVITELLSETSFLTCVTSIFFLDFSWVSCNCLSKWWIQSTYSFYFFSISFTLLLIFCSRAFTLASIAFSTSLWRCSISYSWIL